MQGQVPAGPRSKAEIGHQETVASRSPKGCCASVRDSRPDGVPHRIVNGKPISESSRGYATIASKYLGWILIVSGYTETSTLSEGAVDGRGSLNAVRCAKLSFLVDIPLQPPRDRCFRDRCVEPYVNNFNTVFRAEGSL